MTKRKKPKGKRCIWCGDEFITNKSQVVCCSDECKYARRLKMNATRKRLDTIVACVICGAEFIRGKGRAITCSNRCSSERRRETHILACKKYREKNPEKNRQYYIENKEKCNARSKKYYEYNKKSMLEWQKKYNEINSEKVRKYKSKWYLENKIAQKGEYSSVWLKAEETREISKSTGADTKDVSRVKDYLKSSLGTTPPADLVEEATALRLLNRALKS